MFDLVVLWADLRARDAAATGSEPGREEAARILTEAEALLGPSPSLDRARRAQAATIDSGLAPADPAAEPRSAWEHYDLGRSYLRSGHWDRAAEQFRLGLDLRPQDFWLNFPDGLCHYRLGRYEGTVHAFRVCIALSPATAECYYNRARAYQSLGRIDRALTDYNRALALNPRLRDAALNRGILHYHHGRHAEAIADLELALSTTSNRGALGRIHYNLALVHQARGDREAVEANIGAAIRFDDLDAQELSRRRDRPSDARSSQREECSDDKAVSKRRPAPRLRGSRPHSGNSQ